jgi:cardiolipin synthase (CMP-forming)
LAVLPNLFTLARVGLTPFIALALLERQYGRALLLCFLAGLTDGIDGTLARRFNGVTRLGAYLDPAADKLLIAVVYICLGWVGELPWWIVAIVFGRDLLILGMVAWGFWFTTIRTFPPSLWGKLSTALQILAALVVMAAAAEGWTSLREPAIWAMLAATVWSGIHYAVHGLRLLRTSAIDAGSGRG